MMVEGNKLTDKSAARIATHLADSDSITTLNVRENEFTDNGIENIFSFLMANKKLKRIYACDMSRGLLSYSTSPQHNLIKGITKNIVTELRLSKVLNKNLVNSIKEVKVVEAIGYALMNNTSLQILDLSILEY